MFKRFNIYLYLLTVISLVILTTVSLIATAGLEEGTARGKLIEFFASVFPFFRFPTHTLFNNILSGFPSFMGGLIVNCLLYALVIERLIFFFKSLR